MALTGSEKGITRSARVSIGVNVVLICALGVLLAGVSVYLVSRLSYRVRLRFDWTAESRFKPDPLAIKILRGLNEPIQVRFAYGFDPEIGQRIVDLSGRPRDDVYAQHYRPILEAIAVRTTTVLTEWSATSEQLRVSIVDADQDPKRVAEWARETGKKPAELVNKVIMTRGADERVIPMTPRLVAVDWGYFPPDPRMPFRPPQVGREWRIQPELLSVLRGLANGEQIALHVPEGKRGRFDEDSGEFEPLKRLLAAQGFVVKSFRLEAGVPTDGILMMPAVGVRLSSAEVAAIKAHDGRGGRSLVVVDPGLPEDFKAMLEPYGFRADAAAVEDQQNAEVNQPDRTQLRSTRLCCGMHEIDRPLQGRTDLLVGACRPLVDEQLKSAGAVRTPLLRASSDAKALPIEYDAQTGAATPTPGAKRAASGAILAAALERPAPDNKTSRVVLVGGSDLLAPGPLSQGVNLGNRDFFLNALNWLADRPTVIGAPEPETPGSQFELTPSSQRLFGMVAVGVLPAILGVAAILIWFRRRN